MSPIPPSPGRLQVTESLERVQITLPTDLGAVPLLWGLVCALGTMGGLSVVGSMGWVGLMAALLVLLVLWGIGQLVRGTIPIRRGYHGIVALLLAGMTAAVALLLQMGDLRLLATVLGGLAGALLYAVPLGLLARQTPRLLIAQGTLTVQQGARSRHLPLEGLDPRHLPLQGLRPEEHAWLLDLLAVHVDRRARTLAAEGHDLAEPPHPPASLETLRQR